MKLLAKIFALSFILGTFSCQPYYSTNLNSRHHIRVDKVWLGYLPGPLLSNRLTCVKAVKEGSELDADGNPIYNLYVAGLKGLQLSTDEGNSWSTIGQGKNDGVETPVAITGVYEIYDWSKKQVILFSTANGFYYKKYNQPEIFKVNSTSNYPLKRVILDEYCSDPATQKRNDLDIEGNAIDVDEEKEVVYIGTSTGVYFSTDFKTDTLEEANKANWGCLVGRPIITMRHKTQDYPLTTIPGAYKKFCEETKKMEIFYPVDSSKGSFYTGEEAWKISEVNYDPIYDPVYNAIYNKDPDFYAESDGKYKDSKGVQVDKVKGQPITWEQYCCTTVPSLDPKTKSYNDLTAEQKKAQYAARLYYETVLEKTDRANPNNTGDGVIRIYAYYRDFRLKGNNISGVSVYNGILHLAINGASGGVAYAPIPDGLDSSKPKSYSSHFLWETYTNNYFHYPSIQKPVADRGEENFWSIADTRGLCITADEKGIFYGAMGGGIHQAPTYKSVRTVRDVFGLPTDNNGNTQCILTVKGDFQYFNQFFYPELAQAYPEYNKEQVADLYYRYDRDANDGLGNDNLQQGLRLNWQEYTTSGWSIYVAQGEVKPYQSPVLNFPNNTIRKIRFGSLDTMQLIYIATNDGMGVAEIRKNYSVYNTLKVPATVTGTEQYSIDFSDWGNYHKDPLILVESIFVQDLCLTKDKHGSDKYIYAATDGQGLVRFYWKEYKQKTFNIDLGSLSYGGNP